MTVKEQVIKYRNENPAYRTLLGTVLGEFDRVGKEPTDDQCVQIIKKMIESLLLINGTKEKEEAFILEQFIPKQLTEHEIKEIIKENNFSSIAECMKGFKQLYPNLYDGKLVSLLYNQQK